MTDNFSANQDFANATKGFRSSAILRQQRRDAGDGGNGNQGAAANVVVPRKKLPATRIRHRVSGTNRRARSA